MLLRQPHQAPSDQLHPSLLFDISGVGFPERYKAAVFACRASLFIRVYICINIFVYVQFSPSMPVCVWASCVYTCLVRVFENCVNESRVCVCVCAELLTRKTGHGEKFAECICGTLYTYTFCRIFVFSRSHSSFVYILMNFIFNVYAVIWRRGAY